MVAWYASAALLINGMTGRVVLPIGGPIWTDEMGVQHPSPAQAHA